MASQASSYGSPLKWSQPKLSSFSIHFTLQTLKEIEKCKILQASIFFSLNTAALSLIGGVIH
ncbi:UNVERIFIED_CONTAM: hypothetical protein NCL1_60240 [Trichonephila clavipes]